MGSAAVGTWRVDLGQGLNWPIRRPRPPATASEDKWAGASGTHRLLQRSGAWLKSFKIQEEVWSFPIQIWVPRATPPGTQQSTGPNSPRAAPPNRTPRFSTRRCRRTLLRDADQLAEGGWSLVLCALHEGLLRQDLPRPRAQTRALDARRGPGRPDRALRERGIIRPAREEAVL